VFHFCLSYFLETKDLWLLQVIPLVTKFTDTNSGSENLTQNSTEQEVLFPYIDGMLLIGMLWLAHSGLLLKSTTPNHQSQSSWQVLNFLYKSMRTGFWAELHTKPHSSFNLLISLQRGQSSSYIRVIHKVMQLGGENGQFWHNWASNVELGIKILQKEITGFQTSFSTNFGGKLSFILSFLFPERLHCCYIYFHCSYLYNYYNYSQTLCIKCCVSAFHIHI